MVLANFECWYASPMNRCREQAMHAFHHDSVEHWRARGQGLTLVSECLFALDSGTKKPAT